MDGSEETQNLLEFSATGGGGAEPSLSVKAKKVTWKGLLYVAGFYTFVQVLNLVATLAFKASSSDPTEQPMNVLRGYVTDETGAPLPECRVEVSGSLAGGAVGQISRSTDARGRFSFNALDVFDPAAVLQLTMSKQGFATASIDVDDRQPHLHYELVLKRSR